MLTFWVDGQNTSVFESYLQGRGAPIRDRFELRSYRWDGAPLEVVPGPQIFSGFDRLTPAGRAAVAQLNLELRHRLPGIPVLNDPSRSLLRRPLLDRLAELGVNSFRVWSGTEAERVSRYPVFVRRAGEHDGNLSPILDNPRALRRTLWGLRLRGHRPGDLLIVEYCDTRDADGKFRKYGAFRVGDAIIPAHLLIARHWMTKAEGRERSLAEAREEQEYVEQNPHRSWLARVFDIAGIEYGRIDYAVSRGTPQAWEINLNPTIGPAAHRPPREAPPEVAAVRRESRALYHERLRQAFLALDRPAAPAGARLRLELDPGLLAPVRAEAARDRRRRGLFAALGRLYHLPVARPLRAALRRFSLVLVGLVLTGASLSAQSAALRGVVRDDSTKKPVPQVEVLLEGSAVHASSDRAGRFLLNGTPGRHTVLFRLIGYRPLRMAVTLVADDTAWADPLLVPGLVELEPIVVTEQPKQPRGLGLEGLEERRRMGFGKFIDSTELRRFEDLNLVDVLRHHADLRWEGDLLASRRYRGLHDEPCYLQVVLDGTVLYRPIAPAANAMTGERPEHQAPPNIRTLVEIANLQAVELYLGPAGTPPEYGGTGGGCGTLMLWTKQR